MLNWLETVTFWLVSLAGRSMHLNFGIQVQLSNHYAMTASQESSHCPMWYSLTEALLFTDALAHSSPLGCTNMHFSQWAWLHRHCAKSRRTSLAVCAILVNPDLVLWALALQDSSSLATFPENRPFSGAGHDLGPLPRPLKLPLLARGQAVEDLSGLSMVVIDFEVASVH